MYAEYVNLLLTLPNHCLDNGCISNWYQGKTNIVKVTKYTFSPVNK